MRPVEKDLVASALQKVARISSRPICMKCFVSDCEHLTNKPSHLTAREISILRLLRDGLDGNFPTDREIGLILGISPGTIKTCSSIIYKKLKVSNRLNAALWAKNHPEVFNGV